jgi:hypothetical protein
MKRLVVLMVAAASVLAGCEREPVRDVDYWSAHDQERKAKVEECANNPGEMDASANCVNAKKAESAKRLHGKRGNIPKIQ